MFMDCEAAAHERIFNRKTRTLAFCPPSILWPLCTLRETECVHNDEVALYAGRQSKGLRSCLDELLVQKAA